MQTPERLRTALRRRSGTVLALGLTGLLVGGAAGVALPKHYSASAEILLAPLEGTPFADGSYGAGALATEAQVVTSEPVLALAVKSLGGSVETLGDSLEVEVLSGSEVLRISSTADTARGAQRQAEAVAQAALTFRSQRAAVARAAEVKSLDSRIAGLAPRLAAAQNAAKDPGKDGAASAAAQVGSLTGALVDLQDQVARLQTAPADAGRVTAEAALPGESGPDAVTLAAIGLVLGLLAGVVVAVALDAREDRVRDESGVEGLGAKVLGGLGDRTGWSSRASELIPAEHRRLRSSFLTALPSGAHVVLVARAERSEHASDVVGPLAVALARIGVRTCVVDAAVGDWLDSDLLEDDLSDGAETGLATVLAGSADVDSVLLRPSENLAVLPRGRWSPQATEHLGGPRMTSTLTALRHRFDVVLVSSPNLQSPDGLVLLDKVDAVLVEAVTDVTGRSELRSALAQVTGSCLLLGVVLSTPARRTPHRSTESGSADHWNTIRDGGPATDVPSRAVPTRTAPARTVPTRTVPKRAARSDARPDPQPHPGRPGPATARPSKGVSDRLATLIAAEEAEEAKEQQDEKDRELAESQERVLLDQEARPSSRPPWAPTAAKASGPAPEPLTVAPLAPPAPPASPVRAAEEAPAPSTPAATTPPLPVGRPADLVKPAAPGHEDSEAETSSGSQLTAPRTPPSIDKPEPPAAAPVARRVQPRPDRVPMDRTPRNRTSQNRMPQELDADHDLDADQGLEADEGTPLVAAGDETPEDRAPRKSLDLDRLAPVRARTTPATPAAPAARRTPPSRPSGVPRRPANGKGLRPTPDQTSAPGDDTTKDPPPAEGGSQPRKRGTPPRRIPAFSHFRTAGRSPAKDDES